MPKIIFLNRYFFPDLSATSQILSEVAFDFAKRHQVHVITSQQLYDKPAAQLPPEETIRGVEIHRIATTQFGRSKLVGRSLDYISFYFAVRRALASLAAPDDIVVAKTDPPLLSIAVLPVVRRRRARLINWLQDLYPDVAITSGIQWLKGPIGAALIYLRDRSLKAAVANVVVGRSMGDRLITRGIPHETVHFIPNFSADDSIMPVPAEDNPLRQEWGLAGKFVVGYSGNLGRVHEFQTILEAADRLRDDPRIVFLCIGGGRRFEDLVRAVGERRLQERFVFRPYQERKMLRYSLSAADVHWISLRPEFEGLVFPSKFYGIAAAGRPIIAITAKESELAALVENYHCGFAIEPGDAPALVAGLNTLSEDSALRANMGACARIMLEQNFTHAQAFKLWQNLVEKVDARDQRG